MRILYLCEYCSESDDNEEYIINHEAKCIHNPSLNIRDCENCEHSSITTVYGEMSPIKCLKNYGVYDMNADTCKDWKRED